MIGGVAEEPRRRGAARTAELLDVTLALAGEAGYAGLNVEAAARRAGGGKHTIYPRRAPTGALLLDPLRHAWATDPDHHATRDPRPDPREQVLPSGPPLA